MFHFLKENKEIVVATISFVFAGVVIVCIGYMFVQSGFTLADNSDQYPYSFFRPPRTHRFREFSALFLLGLAAIANGWWHIKLHKSNNPEKTGECP